MSLALSLCQYVLRPRRDLAQASPGLAQASPSLEAPRLQALETRDLLHQHNRKEKVFMIKTKKVQEASFWVRFLHLKLIWFLERELGPPLQFTDRFLQTYNGYLTVHMHMHCSKIGLKMFKWVQGGSAHCTSLTKLSHDHYNLSFLLCWWKRSRIPSVCNRGASRLGEAWLRPRLGRKTYCSKHAVDFPMRETWLCIFCK